MTRFALAFLVSLLPLAALAEPITGLAARVGDGDDITLTGGIRVRLCGIDAPEAGRPGGSEATAFLESLVRDRALTCLPVGEGTPCDGRSKPHNGKRRIAQCFADGADVAAAMVAAGHARDWPKYSGGFYGR